MPCSRDVCGNEKKWAQPTEVILPGGTRQQKSYDGLPNLEGLSVKNANQQPLLELANKLYSKRLELLSKSRTDSFAGLSTTYTANYTYDDESRLIKYITDETGILFAKDTETFTLDGVGNRVEHGKQLGSWDYDANNRLTERGILFDKATYNYDDNGNLTQKAKGGNSTNYAYDSQNRLVEVKDKDNNPIARYVYDPFDRRIWKEVYRSKDGAALSQPTRSYYFYADEGLIAESQQAISINTDQTVTTSAAPAITTQYGPRPDGEFTTAILFIKTKDSKGQDTVAYYHHDHLGTPIQATDRSGIIVWSAQYNAFGNVSITTPTATDDKPVIASNLRFAGQVEDAETGLYYNWHRYYDPDTGRYVTADPIGLNGGFNFYTYVDGNPVNLIDPTGDISIPKIPKKMPWQIIIGQEAIKKCLKIASCKAALEKLEQKAKELCDKVECKFHKDREGHEFDVNGKKQNCAHYQINCWLKGQKGNDPSNKFSLRWRLPALCWKRGDPYPKIEW